METTSTFAGERARGCTRPQELQEPVQWMRLLDDAQAYAYKIKLQTRPKGKKRLEAIMLRAGSKHLAAGVGAACPVDAHRLGGVQLLLQLLHYVHGPVLGLDHCKPAELQQHTDLLRGSNLGHNVHGPVLGLNH